MIAPVRLFAVRHGSAVASVVLALSVVGSVAAAALVHAVPATTSVRAADLIYLACQLLPYGAVGAVLVARRPDLPFGWLLALAAVALVLVLAIGGPSVATLEHRGDGLALWGVAASSSLQFVPVAIEGLINVRFPSGSPTGRLGRLLDRAIIAGILIALLGGVLGDSAIRAIYPHGPPDGARRVVDGTAVTDLGNVAVIAVPVVILLGVVAGIRIIVQFLRADGIERRQLRWRAVGVAGALVLFPFAVTEHLPDAVADLAPLLFVITLVVPVLRYDLWAIDSIIRRSATASFASPTAGVEHLVRATGQLLHLPYVVIRHRGEMLASYGQATGTEETWALTHDGEPVGELAAAPQHGYRTFRASDRQVLAALAQLVGGAVRAETLHAELLDARRRLVTAREEERRRLRRDLHDGLGPLLTGLGLNLDAAGTHLGRSDEAALACLGSAKQASTQVITSLRELVQGLRPAALDELGLAGALNTHLERLTADAGLTLDLSVPTRLVVPAAVEVAVFRTAVEAVTNVIRHGYARSVRVEIVDGTTRLTIQVVDDGVSPAPWSPGLGLVGMRERAEELGGSFSAGPTSDGGCVSASYPLVERP